MDEDTLRVLLGADDVDRCESPRGFRWETEMAKVRALGPVLERIAGRKFEVDENVQDASFFTDLGTYDTRARPQGGTLRFAVLTVRFSSFGRLFTVWSVDDDAEAVRGPKLPPEIVRAVIDAVGQQGYVYVDAEALHADYTGANPHLQGGSWWIRFFDYL